MECNLICDACEEEAYDLEVRETENIQHLEMTETIANDGTVFTSWECPDGHIQGRMVHIPRKGRHRHQGYWYYHPVTRKHRDNDTKGDNE